MPVDNFALTQEEIDFLAQATLSRRIAKRGEVQPLDRIESGTYKYAMQRAKNFGPPVQGGFRFYVKANRGQKIQWWQGADILTFENRQTLSDMVFPVGKGHLGFELLYDTIERNGIRVNYNRGIREGQSDKAVIERVVNIIEQTMDDVEYNWASEMRKHFFKSNIDQPKCFTGVDGLFPSTTNNTGTIGGRPRTNRLFQHQLFTGITKDNLMLAFFKLIRAANRRAGGTKIDWIACGDNGYNTLVDLFAGASTTAGKFDYRALRDKAMSKGEKYNMSIPQDAFMYEDTLIVNDPVFEELDLENPTASPTWSNQFRFFNFSHFGILPVIDEMMVPHSMPYNQRLERTSVHGEATEWCDLPSSQGVLVLA